MFPTEHYIDLCILHAEMLGRVWEPKFGDWAITNTENIVTVVGLDRFAPPDGKETYLVVHPTYIEDGCAWHKWKSNLIWLPQPRQLIELLEERGYEKWQITNTPLDPCSVELGSVFAEGPDPASALLLALVEVMGKEER